VKRKVIRTTIIAWALVVIGWGYVYVLMGAGWPPVAAEYEIRRDYRLVFFAYSYLPVLTFALAACLLIEWRFLPEESERH
jgi:hypothetical protein